MAGANAILDVKLRTIPFAIDGSMDFTLVGTAVHVAGLAPSNDPIVASVPALEFVKLLEADVVPTGIAVGADYEWLDGGPSLPIWRIEVRALSELWERVRTRAHQELRSNARSQGNGVLAHVNFSQAFMRELDRSRHYTLRDNTLRAISWSRRLSMHAARRRCPMKSASWWICMPAEHH